MIVHTVYHIFNAKNGKAYVGKTCGTLRARWWRHCHDALKTQKRPGLFQLAIRKYGVENFIISTLTLCETNEDACAAERYWITFFDSMNAECGYNMTAGGEGTFGFHQSMSSATRARMSASHTGKVFTSEHRQKLSDANLGKHTGMGDRHPWFGNHVPDDVRKKMSDAARISSAGERNGMHGKKHNIDSREKMRHAQQLFSDEQAAELLALNQVGMSRSELAVLCGVSWGTITNTLKRAVRQS